MTFRKISLDRKIHETWSNIFSFVKYARQLVGNFMSTSTRKWRTLVARYTRDNCVLTLMITWNYVCAALYVHWARLRLTATLYTYSKILENVNNNLLHSATKLLLKVKT